MGVVYSAHDPELARKVAIKLWRPATTPAEKDAIRARLVREARLLAQVSHPNVVAVFDVGVFGDEVFIAMEHVEGRTLRDWARERHRSPREVIDVYLQAGRGLVAAHSANVVHRDFKPDNEEGARLARLADATIGRLGDDDVLRAQLEDRLASLGWRESRYAQARAHAERNVALCTKVHAPTDVRIAEALDYLSVIDARLGRFDEALASSDRSLVILEGAVGPAHPTLATALIGRSIVLRSVKRHGDALENGGDHLFSDAALQRGLRVPGVAGTTGVWCGNHCQPRPLGERPASVLFDQTRKATSVIDVGMRKHHG